MLAYALIVGVFIWRNQRNVGPARKVTLPSKKDDPARRGPPSIRANLFFYFFSRVNGSPSVV